MRNMSFSTTGGLLYPNIVNAESTSGNPQAIEDASGFLIPSGQSTGTYIYLAIRMQNKPPTNGTGVFQPVVYTGTNTDNRLVNTGIKTDMVMARVRSTTSSPGFVVGDRLRGQPYLSTATTNSELVDSDSLDQQLVSSVEYGTSFSSMNGFWVGNDATANINANITANNHITLAFKRAPGFMDIVCYTGTGVARTVPHQLGVVPELMIIKCRNTPTNSTWPVYYGPPDRGLILNGSNSSSGPDTTYWNNTSPTSTVFSLSTYPPNNTINNTYVAYLFASLPGISKVGSYTGNGSSQTINCGFATGVRFLLVKRVDSTGDWYIWESARGIVSGNDPHLSTNTAAEVTSDDSVDPDSTGFIVNQVAATNINVNSASYIFFAIA